MAGMAVARSGLFRVNASRSRLSQLLHKEFTAPLPAIFSSNQQRHEVLASQSLRTSWIRCCNTNKAASAKSEENEKPNKGYFGRDTIAVAAARFAPAVARVDAQERVGGMGSGTVIHEDGYILTCAHVVFGKTEPVYSADGEVSVWLQDEKKDVMKKFVGRVVDAYVDLDIAIIKIDSPSFPLPKAKVGSSSTLRPGDWAIAMGCPLSLHHSVTLGIISCVRRKSEELKLKGMPKEYIQTDCAINPGNSGGPLCNVDGEVVGVNTETVDVAKASGVSFAVPVDFISAMIKPFQNYQRPVRPDFGWVMQNFSEKNPGALKKGVFVHKVIKGSPAEHAGLQAGDVVVDFNSKPITSMKEMMDVMGERSGEPVEVIVRRARYDKDDFVLLSINLEEKDLAAPRPRL